MKLNYSKLGNYIKESKLKNEDSSETNLVGLSNEKKFTASKANIIGTDLSNYKLISHNQFVYTPTTSRNGDKISIALFKEERGIISSSYTVFGIDSNLLNPDYLMLWFERPEFDRYARYHSHGSVREIFSWEDMENIELYVPPVEHQNKVVNIKNLIDNRISILTQMNKNLFNIASSFQTDWMINFTPFKSKEFKSSSFGLIPEDWNVGKLGDVIELLDSKRVPLSGQERENMEKIYPYYGAASLMDYVDDYIFDGIYLLMGEDGTVIDEKGFPILQYVWGKFWVNNHAHILKGKNGFNVDSLYLLLSKTNIQSIVTGAVQAKVNQSNLKSIEIIIPPVEVMNEFNELIKPFFDAIRSNHDEIEKLQKLRDTLLPKLMSGEIDVSKINCDLEV